MGNFSYEQPLFRPPSEANSLIIQATIGGEEEFAASLTWKEIQELLT